MVAVSNEIEPQTVYNPPQERRYIQQDTCVEVPAKRPRSMKSAKLLSIVGVTVVVLFGIGWYIAPNYFSHRAVLKLPGIVEEQEIRLSSKIGGRIKEVFAVEGASVAQGAVLVTFESPEVEARILQLQAQLKIADARLKQARNGPLPEQIESARAAVEMAEARLASLKSGSRAEEISQAKSDVSNRIADEARARSELDRMRTLLPSNTVSQSDIEWAQATWKNAEGQLEIARQRLRLLELGPRVETIAEAGAEVRRLRAELRLIERGTRDEEICQLAAQVDEVHARIKEAQANLSEATIVSPSACLVEVVSVRRGDMASPNQPVVRVRAPDDRWVKAYVPETELSRIRLNQTVQVTHDGSSQLFDGTIVHIASAGEFTPRNVQSVTERQHQVFAIKIRLLDDDGVFKSGMAAEVRIPIDANTAIAASNQQTRSE